MGKKEVESKIYPFTVLRIPFSIKREREEEGKERERHLRETSAYSPQGKGSSGLRLIY